MYTEAAWTRAALEFAQHDRGVGNVLEHASRYERVDRAIAERERIERADNIDRLVVKHIDADDVGMQTMVAASGVDDECFSGIDVSLHLPRKVERKGGREPADTDRVVCATQAVLQPSFEAVQFIIACGNVDEVKAVIPYRVFCAASVTCCGIVRVRKSVMTPGACRDALDSLKASCTRSVRMMGDASLYIRYARLTLERQAGGFMTTRTLGFCLRCGRSFPRRSIRTSGACRLRGGQPGPS